MNGENSMLKQNGKTAAEKIQQRPFTTPPVDIYENADGLLLIADLPGVSSDDLAVNYEKGQLTIEGRRQTSFEGNVLAAEFRPVDYRRTFLVPQGIDADRIAADLTAGILRVTLPKAEALKPRQIHVKSG